MGVIAFTDEWHMESPAAAAARGRAEAVGSAYVNRTTPSATVASLLRMVAAAANSQHAVQVGADAGISGASILDGMAADGVLTVIEADGDADRLSRQTFRELGAGHRARSITGAPGEVLPRLTDHAYDLMVVGAGVTDRSAYLEQARRLLQPSGIVVFLGVFRGGAVLDPNRRDEQVTADRHFLAEVGDDPALSTTLLPLGDGVLLAQVPATAAE